PDRLQEQIFKAKESPACHFLAISLISCCTVWFLLSLLSSLFRMHDLHFLPFGRLFQKFLRLFVDSKSCQNLFCQTDAPGFIRQKNPDSTLLQETQTDGVECSRLKSGKTAALLSSLLQPVPDFSRCLVCK